MQNIIDQKFLLKVVLEVTYKCNFHCAYCFQNSLKSLNTKELSFSDWKQILDILWDNGVIKLTITRGEICTKPDIEKIYQYAYKKGFLIDLASNFSLIKLNPTLFEIIKIYKPRKFIVTLYGDNNVYKNFCFHDNGWDLVKNNIIMLKENGINVTARSIFHKKNIHCVSDIKNFVDKYNIPINIFTTVINDCDLKTDHKDLNLSLDECINIYKLFDKISEIKKRFNSKLIALCNAGNNSAYINPYGDIYLCPPLYNISKKINILSNNFNECLNFLRKERKIYIEKKVPCDNCSNNSFCKKCYPNYLKECNKDKAFLKSNYCIKTEYIKKMIDLTI